MAIEEENMMYLNRPYLTKEEEKHMPKEFRRTGMRTYKAIVPNARKPLKSIFASDLLAHLNVQRQWQE